MFRKNCVFSQFNATPLSPTSLLETFKALNAMRAKSHSYWLVIFCTTNSSRVLANFREFLEKKTQYLMNTLYICMKPLIRKTFNYIEHWCVSLIKVGIKLSINILRRFFLSAICNICYASMKRINRYVVRPAVINSWTNKLLLNREGGNLKRYRKIWSCL